MSYFIMFVMVKNILKKNKIRVNWNKEARV